MKGFTGFRLLLIFVAINTILFGMLVFSMTSDHPWLAGFLPGQFGSGGNSSGYWVFFSLVLLVNAVTVLIAGAALVLPPVLEGVPADEQRLSKLLSDRGGISDESKDAVLSVVREEAASIRRQLGIGRLIMLSGALFFILAFVAVTLSFAHAQPLGSMFASHGNPVPNESVTSRDVWAYTADQIAGAVMLDIPEVYDLRVSEFINNIDAAMFTNFVFAFRTIVGWVALVTLVSLIRSYRLRVFHEKPPATAPQAAAAE